MDWNRIDDSPARIRGFLNERGLALKKRWGQNFLVSRRARERLCELLGPNPGDTVWEVGPGLGGITAIVMETGAVVSVFEVDWGLIEILRERFGESLIIVPGDATVTVVDTDLPLPDLVVGNLPYRSASAIVSRLVETPGLSRSIRRAVFTVQREMALRMVSQPGKKDYSAFSVLCALSAVTRVHGDLQKGNFYPAPEIVSSIVSMEPSDIAESDLLAATRTARALLTNRRKTITNNLGNLSVETGIAKATLAEIVSGAGVDLGARAETLEPEMFLFVGREIAKVSGSPGGPVTA